MARIALLTEKDFDGRSVREASTGGIQTGTVNLAEALVRKGHSVEVYSLLEQQFEYNGVLWRPLGECSVNASDAVIVTNAVDLFARSPCTNRVLWSHNPITASLAWVGDFREAGVVLRGGLPQPELVSELQTARVLFCPGHRDETYCNAAAEATASGLPVVTRGHGSLSERVRDGKTGFIAETADAFAARTIALLRDNSLWLSQHASALADSGLKSWDERAKEWEAAFFV